MITDSNKSILYNNLTIILLCFNSFPDINRLAKHGSDSYITPFQPVMCGVGSDVSWKKTRHLLASPFNL